MKVLNVKSNLHVWRRCRNGYKSTEFQSQGLQAKQEHTHTWPTSSAVGHLANEVFGFAFGITINHLSLIANGSASVTTCVITLPEFKLFWTHNLRKGAEVKCLIKNGHDFDLLDKFMSPIVESLRCGHLGAKMPGKSNNHNYYGRFRGAGQHGLPGKLIISTTEVANQRGWSWNYSNYRKYPFIKKVTKMWISKWWSLLAKQWKKSQWRGKWWFSVWSCCLCWSWYQEGNQAGSLIRTKVASPHCYLRIKMYMCQCRAPLKTPFYHSKGFGSHPSCL